MKQIEVRDLQVLRIFEWLMTGGEITVEDTTFRFMRTGESFFDSFSAVDSHVKSLTTFEATSTGLYVKLSVNPGKDFESYTWGWVSGEFHYLYYLSNRMDNAEYDRILANLALNKSKQIKERESNA